MRFRLALAALAAALLALASAVPASAATVLVHGDGLEAFMSDDGRLQVRFAGESFGQFAPGEAQAADAGFNVAVYPASGAPPTVYGFLGQPLIPSAPPQTFGDPPSVATMNWTAGSHLEIDGAIAAGTDAFVTTYDIRNTSGEAVHVRPSLAADLNIGGSDRGGSFLETIEGEGFRFQFVGGSAGLLRGGFQDVSGDLFDAFEAGAVETIFARVRDPLGPGFNATVAQGQTDNAVGIQSNDNQPGATVLESGASATFATSMRFDRSVPTAERIEQLPAPEPFQQVNAEAARGKVFVRLPGGASASRLGLSPSQTAGAPKGFVPLEQAAQLPVGTIVNADRGHLKLAAAQGTRKGGRLAQALKKTMI